MRATHSHISQCLLCHIFAKTGPDTFECTWSTFAETYVDHIWFTLRLAILDRTTFLPKLVHIWWALLWPYSLFTTLATLGSHSDCTAINTTSLPTEAHMWFDTFGTFEPLQAYIHFVRAIRRPAVPYHCLKWPAFTFSFIHLADAFIQRTNKTIEEYNK